MNCAAATLANLELVMDGSADPPGDILNLALVMAPGEKEVQVQVRGYLVSGIANSRTELVYAAGSKHRDAVGGFLMSVEVSRPERRLAVETSIVVPYEHLNLPPGSHQIAYEVKGICKGVVAFVRATPLTVVRITRMPRQEMLLRQFEARRETEQLRRAYLPGDGIRGSETRPNEKEMEITQSLPVVTEKKVAVNIPKGFLREEVATEPTTGDEQIPEGPNYDRWKHQPWYPLSDILPNTRDRIVHFATTRNRVANDEGDDTERVQFGTNLSGEVTYGAAVVNIPVQHHKTGKLELPAWWERRDPEKHFQVESLLTLAKQDFFREVRAVDVLLFVHGFRNTMEEALLRTAQLKYDLEFPGRCITYSWPSEAGLSENEYLRVAVATKDNVAGLAEVIEALTAAGKYRGDRPEKPRVHVIAHSLGNRLLLDAVWQLIQDGKLQRGSKSLGQVVLAAPDVGALRFNNLVPHVISLSDQVTYYYCQADRALMVSRGINRYEPVGLMPYFDRGLDTVNADGANTSFLGHSYFSSSGRVLMDIQLMINHRLKPEARMPPLASRSKLFGHDHWSFTAMKTKEITQGQ